LKRLYLNYPPPPEASVNKLLTGTSFFGKESLPLLPIGKPTLADIKSEVDAKVLKQDFLDNPTKYPKGTTVVGNDGYINCSPERPLLPPQIRKHAQPEEIKWADNTPSELLQQNSLQSSLIKTTSAEGTPIFTSYLAPPSTIVPTTTIAPPATAPVTSPTKKNNRALPLGLAGLLALIPAGAEHLASKQHVKQLNNA
jgi:hypothetical protein